MRKVLKWIGISLLVIALGAAVTGWTVLRDDGEASETTAKAEATAKITRGNVVQTETYEGTIGYSEAQPVVNQGTGTLTKVPETGTVIGRGEVLYRVNNEPVVLLLGDLPLYRTLAEGAEGKDVRQLEQNLKALGYADDITVDNEFTDGTGEAVEDFREDYGLSDGETINMGDIVFQPTAVRISGTTVEVGGQVGPGASPVEVTSTDKQVTATLDSVDDTTEGATVTVELPDGTRTRGTVESIEESAAAGAESTVTAEISLQDQKAAAEWDTGDVDVDVEVARATNVLVAPVTSLVALSEGGYAVRVVDDTAEQGYRLVAVQPGLFADERVEVSGEGLRAGMTVVVPSE